MFLCYCISTPDARSKFKQMEVYHGECFVTFFIGNVDVDEVLIRGASVKIQERIQVRGESNS